MHHSRLRLAHRWLLSALVLVVTTGSASANYYELLRRVPDSANTLIMIDVERDAHEPDRHEGEVARQGQLARGGYAPLPDQLGALHARGEAQLRLECRGCLGRRDDRDDQRRFRCRTWPRRKGAISIRWKASRSPSRPATPSSFYSSPPSWVSPSRPTGRTWDAGCGRSSVSMTRRSRSIFGMRSRSAHGKITWSSAFDLGDLFTSRDDSRPAASRREPRGQGDRSRRAHQGARHR